MKKIWMSVIVSIMLVCSISISAFAAGSGSMTQDQTQDQTQSQTQDRAQDQSCKQTEVNTADREQARLQIRDRLQISDQAEAQYQDRLQQQDQTRSCFTDTEQHWAREQIGSAYSWGLINGYPNGDFNPDGVISGTEGVLMMSRLMNCLNVEESQADPETSIDLNLVPEWAREQIQEESALRIAAQSQCYGEAQLNRLQFAVMLAKALGVEPEEVTEDTVVFLDQSEIPQEDLGYISALRTLGIIQGTDGCFCADQTVTRAEAAAMLTRILEALE
ncbi:hypothetical protein SDC9_51105 [bioreactor metagenome]|uniref:SLH domain-containing protein n=1 Tax=bioreactor metagenome TaxID=1076179 RepID=A0A644WRF0_9ZZZZ